MKVCVLVHVCNGTHNFTFEGVRQTIGASCAIPRNEIKNKNYPTKCACGCCDAFLFDYLYISRS